ncbi:heterokaryon incompatibility protein-domain-containing protein [Thelonectria olida]|uniref:Heterokaryon incompatibility protein-domain-containing protein n=1 Tax=Thelonectria olida TaxID=1576542 RepID=A0A9P8W1N1_9HYPO|nr:heterokaryon incompatibility protein-domain-containing protein [Thelonectria olida]
MRCKFCKELSIERLVELAEVEFGAMVVPHSAYYSHQPSIAALDASAEQGCDLCQLIVQALGLTTNNDRFAFGLEGFDRSQDSTVLATARGLADFYDSAVRISINTMHIFEESPLLDVKMLEVLLVQVGPPKEVDDPLSDGGDNYEMQSDLHPAKLLIMSQGTSVYCGNYEIGRRGTGPILDSKSNIAIAQGWISKCRNEHGSSCGTHKGDLPLPTRVIDVGSENDKTKLFISQGTKGDYIALSHCWGGPIATVLQTTNIKDFCQGLPYDQLPLNFKDAINITRRLGIRHIWVDSLCIMQDSSDDWTIESTKMAAVYENAVVTIAALCSPGSSHGILRTAQQQSSSPDAARIAGPGGSVLTLQAYKKDEDENLRDLLDNAPLTSRGWCFQESVLSRRVLYYGTKQVYWECREGFQAANGVPGPNFLPKSGLGINRLDEFLLQDFSTSQIPLQGHMRTMLLWNYYATVSSYSRRKLTFSTDKLPAFSGLAQRLQPLTGCDYIAGLWAGDIRHGLLWGAYGERQGLEDVQPYRAPSWSWASRNGPIYFRMESNHKALHPNDVEILEAEAEPKDKRAPFAEVTRGHLLLRGLTQKLRRIHGKKVEYDDRVGQVTFDDHKMAGGRTGALVHIYTSRASESDPTICVGPDRPLFAFESQYQKLLGRDEQRDYLVLWVKRATTGAQSSKEGKNDIVHCIILEKAQEVGPGEDVYRRVGYFVTDHDKHEVIGEWKLRTLKII